MGSFTGPAGTDKQASRCRTAGTGKSGKSQIIENNPHRSGQGVDRLAMLTGVVLGFAFVAKLLHLRTLRRAQTGLREGVVNRFDIRRAMECESRRLLGERPTRAYSVRFPYAGITTGARGGTGDVGR